jgi:hypothetical protein
MGRRYYSDGYGTGMVNAKVLTNLDDPGEPTSDLATHPAGGRLDAQVPL